LLLNFEQKMSLVFL